MTTPEATAPGTTGAGASARVSDEVVLRVEDLRVHYQTAAGNVPAVDGVSVFDIEFATDGTAYIGTSDGVWKSADDGASWAQLALGIGPTGGAFYLWDHAVKRGDIRALGALSYATPILSTGLLIVLGLAAPSGTLLVATLLVTAGAVLASRDLWKR